MSKNTNAPAAVEAIDDDDLPLSSQILESFSRSATSAAPNSLMAAYTDWAIHLASSPAIQSELVQKAATIPTTIAGQIIAQSLAQSDVDDEADHRFDGAGWRQWPFNVFKAAFQASNAWSHQAVQVPGVSAHHQKMVSFYTRQTMDAVCPSNWPMTNPEVLREGFSTRGQSWIHGYQSYLNDLIQRQKSRIQTDQVAMPPLDFEVGHDVAVTPGKVVFRNHLIELIQYAPTTDTVYPEPILIVPSCIMKYYILDLSPGNSMVRYLVAKGHTVFMVSWRNPDASDHDLGMDDYLQLGVMDAMAAIRAGVGATRIHAIGYCLGGTFLSIAVARLSGGDDAEAERTRYPELASVTLLAALTDFTEPGEMSVFIDEEQIKTLRAQMERTGYLSGKQMAGTFQFLNSRDLIWSRNAKRYLLGQDEVGNDMMSWNADVTRLPSRMHSEYLDQLFLQNALATGHFRFGDVGVSLMNIQAPLLVVGTVRDHVCPWPSVYKIHQLTKTNMTFILAAGGHNAGIVSEPGHARRSYQMGNVDASHGWIEPVLWQATAPKTDGSWWESMHQWLHDRSSTKVAAVEIPAASALCDAPGEYVLVRYAD